MRLPTTYLRKVCQSRRFHEPGGPSRLTRSKEGEKRQILDDGSHLIYPYKEHFCVKRREPSEVPDQPFHIGRGPLGEIRSVNTLALLAQPSLGCFRNVEKRQEGADSSVALYFSASRLTCLLRETALGVLRFDLLVVLEAEMSI